MAEPAEKIDPDRSAESELDQRVDNLITAHQGDARAVIETLLMAIDARAERISFGFVRGRLPRVGLAGDACRE
ncbi:hypothetical protein [Kaistia sp. 32K]|uniref:hypothetical protein n=1 Tax=Kaistia sp. 32K TaxID=2795690 RepID=UPI0019168962|nr:hypothetical protein [Kaistia sp. 32K]